MFAIPVSARLASIALRLEPKLEAALWLTLSVLFVFLLSISDTWAVANYPSWAILRVFYGGVYPLLPGCNASVRRKGCEVVRRELRILGEIRALSRRGANRRIWTEISNVLKRLGGPETRKDVRDIYGIVAKPKVIAEAQYKFVSCIIWAVLVTMLFRFDSPFALSRSHWLSLLVYPPRKYAWIHEAHIIWILSSQTKTIATIQLRALLWLQRWALISFFLISNTFEGLLAMSVFLVLENIDRFFWILGKAIASLVEQLFFELIFAGLFRLWNGPVENWDFSGRNFYLSVKAWRMIRFLWDSRRQLPLRTNFKTNWARQERYSYTPLNSHGKSVRLLVLHPRIPLSDVRCSLFEVPLDNVPSYEAISYTWGDASVRENIWVNGKRLNVPKSAYTVLSNRSSLWRPKILWIDAICINQKDTRERNSQVLLMREIYGKAFIVSVCLQTSPAPEGAFPQVHEMNEALLASDMVNELVFLNLKTYASELDIFFQYAGYIRQPRWLAFLELVRNPWFSRIWVVQEVALASSIQVFYGRSQFPWRYLLDAITTCRQHPALGSFLEVTKDPLTRLRPQGSAITLETMNDFRQRFKDNEISFTSVLYDSNIFNATDARDHVFGLYGFYNGELDDRVTPNYEKSEPEVYKHVAQYLLEQDQPLRLLSYGGVGFFANDQEGKPYNKRLPSWCPNWSRQPMVRVLSYADPRIQKHHYRAGGSNGRKPECSERDQFASLVLRGRILGSIVSLGPPLTAPSGSNTGSGEAWNVNELNRLFSAAEESWDRLNSSSFVKKLYPHVKPPQHSREAFWRTLIGDRTDTESPAPPLCAISFEKWFRFGRDILNQPGSFSPNTVVSPDLMRSYDVKEMFGSLIPACGLNRRLCITENGYIGMVPPLSVNRDKKCEGDVICLIRGAQVPFVLRPVTSVASDSHATAAGRKRFQLVGEAYIHGIMNGEMARWEDEDSVEESIEIV